MEQLKHNVDISKGVTLQCGQCDGIIFKQSLILKKINKLAIGAVQDAIVPIQVFRCEECGAIIPDLLPIELQRELFSDAEDNKEESTETEKGTESKIIQGF